MKVKYKIIDIQKEVQKKEEQAFLKAVETGEEYSPEVMSYTEKTLNQYAQKGWTIKHVYDTTAYLLEKTFE